MKLERASGGYTVMEGNQFLGRVKRLRTSYDHSNGRTYRGWSWAAYPFPVRADKPAQFHHRTRKSAVDYLSQ